MSSASPTLLFAFVLIASSTLAQIIAPVDTAHIVTEHAQKIKESPTSSPCQRACADIAVAIPWAYFARDEHKHAFFAGMQDVQVPQCRVEPKTPEEVSTILKSAIQEQCHFAIRSGGHSRIPGSSNAEDGITIDLRNFNGVEIAEDKKTVRIGAGAVWGDVYRFLEPKGLAVIGGRVSDVGVGGLTLGGGLSFLSNRHGWATDNIAAFEVVLPDTTVKTITQESDPDMFWALRGGGNNFGVVTAFHTNLIERNADMWRFTGLYSEDKFPELLAAQNDFVSRIESEDQDTASHFAYGHLVQYNMTIAYPALLHATHKDEKSWPAIFNSVQNIGTVPNTSEVIVKPMSACTDDVEKMTPYGQRHIWKTITYRQNREVDEKILNVFLKELEPLKKIQGIIPFMVFHPIAPTQLKHMSKNGGNPLGLADEKGPLMLVQTSWAWDKKEDDEPNMQANHRIFDKAIQIAKEAGVHIPYIYQNYAWIDQDVYSGYGEDNLRRLKAIQKRVDPDGVFAGGEGLCRGYFKVNVKAEATGDFEPTTKDEL